MKSSLHCILACAVLAATGAAQAQDLTVISFGGATKAAQDKAYFKPFDASGAGKVIAGEYNGEMAKVKAMVNVGKVTWDVVEVESPELLRGCDEGLFERIDPAAIGDESQFVPGTFSECGVATYVWSMVMAYDSKRLAKAPTSWADFWNVKDYPGKRGLRKGAKYTLEVALLADGVKPEDLYKVLGTPEGVSRAFRKLDEIKPYIQWWEAGAQPPQWLAAGDVVMSAAYNGRIAAAQKEGVPLAIVWPGSLYDPEYWAVVKGTPNKALAEKFIAFASQPQTQKVFSENIPYGPVHKGTLELLPADVQAALPTAPANLQGARSVDSAFWVDHGEELELRFNAWAAR
ncbi:MULTISPECIES: ABC transporter substrate-binding protein [Pseudomonas]|jgi:putative spermidine/putrescine transport system substrate-binding protein|uniref:ABC transporter substrate-binding protein n=1 Tax=Pseudomonas TaxID=286 RepID=UPI0002A258AC|nr:MULTISPECIES: ABC transporter substrate-binding protein [Pseudomonas]KSW24937.1 spermidine/putrescine ABC transporter substrate-binding protein [Pseudomonas sp. ADP]KWR86737.1 spermidine/putrescine ABC transporter substrate-binding protein [Pseudomonas sp. PI1]MBB1607371.1 spermidine/putrescine ABC transporter substrate-binding protein [Pseudomonas sp. UMC76]MBB1639510.1 spermidine/putrescine ABC transporter substrate-binding protein [Pseudomonas sp. UME83]NTX87924.1 extracellular solute-bi